MAWHGMDLCCSWTFQLRTVLPTALGFDSASFQIGKNSSCHRPSKPGERQGGWRAVQGGGPRANGPGHRSQTTRDSDVQFGVSSDVSNRYQSLTGSKCIMNHRGWSHYLNTTMMPQSNERPRTPTNALHSQWWSVSPTKSNRNATCFVSFT